MKAIHTRLKALVTKTCPFQPKPKIKDPVTWVRPEIVCQVRFLDWTTDGMLRAPVFIGLRDDKVAEEVVREPQPKAATLNLSAKEAMVELNGHTLKFSNLDKVFFPRDGWKKRDLLCSITMWQTFWCPISRGGRFP